MVEGRTKGTIRPKFTSEAVVRKVLGLMDITKHDAPIELNGENGFVRPTTNN